MLRVRFSLSYHPPERMGACKEPHKCQDTERRAGGERSVLVMGNCFFKIDRKDGKPKNKAWGENEGNHDEGQAAVVKKEVRPPV